MISGLPAPGTVVLAAALVIFGVVVVVEVAERGVHVRAGVTYDLASGILGVALRLRKSALLAIVVEYQRVTVFLNAESGLPSFSAYERDSNWIATRQHPLNSRSIRG